MKKLQMLHSFTLTALHDKRHYKVVRSFIMCKINVCVRARVRACARACVRACVCVCVCVCGNKKLFFLFLG